MSLYIVVSMVLFGWFAWIWKKDTYLNIAFKTMFFIMFLWAFIISMDNWGMIEFKFEIKSHTALSTSKTNVVDNVEQK